MGNWINQDFAVIIPLLENSILADRFQPRYVLPAMMLYNEILDIQFPQGNRDMITEIMNRIRQEIENLDEALSLIDREMPKKEE